MKRVLSLLLLIPFLAIQGLARGPFDDALGRSQAAVAGTYGLALGGVGASSGVMVMSVPSTGFATGKLMVFHRGLMFAGSATGNVNSKEGNILLMTQVSHYTAHSASDGIQKQGVAFVDHILSGTFNLSLQLDYFSGIIQVSGSGALFDYDAHLTSVTTQTAISVQTAAQNTLANLNSNNTSTGNSSTTAGKANNSVSTTDTTGTTTNPDGSITTLADSQRATASSGNTQDSSTSLTSTSVQGSGKTQDSTSGSQSSTTMYNAPVQAFNDVPFLTLVAYGLREDTTVSALPTFAAPVEAGGFQIGVTVPAAGAGNATGGGAAAGGAGAAAPAAGAGP